MKVIVVIVTLFSFISSHSIWNRYSFAVEKSATIPKDSNELLVPHRPGKASIHSNLSVVHVGNRVTLTCSANPPGWPVPQFRWFHDDEDEPQSGTILVQGSKYIIPRANSGSEGRYHCHAVNELGDGDMATITLEVLQPPQFTSRLQPYMTFYAGETDFSVMCSAKGKPKPHIKWLKNGRTFPDHTNLYEVNTTSTDSSSGMVTVQSVLRFNGTSRPDNNQLIPSDRGLYTCLYQNEVNSANSSMHLRIENAPIITHRYNKTAYGIRENATIICKVLAYPKPEFEWQFGSNPTPLSMSSDGKYEINTITDDNDVYTSVLRINSIAHQDYGEYVCRVINAMDTITASIRLQPKGSPDKPNNLQASYRSWKSIKLSWDPGFDGGLVNTKYVVSYRKVATPHDDQFVPGCKTNVITNTDWMEFDCHQNIPCDINLLEQHQSYVLKVKAVNTKGSSDYSDEIIQTTKLGRIPPALRVSLYPKTQRLVVTVDATCLSLIAIVELVINDGPPVPTWMIVETMHPLQNSGDGPTHAELKIQHLFSRESRIRTLGTADGQFSIDGEFNPRVRVKLCLRANIEHCSHYVEAEIEENSIAEASPTLISIIVSIIVLALFVGLVAMFCCCKRK